MKKPTNTQYQHGSLLVLTLLMLLIISFLGISAMNTTGMEMQMSSNNLSQQMAFEGAEYTLSQVENNIKTSPFSHDSIINNSMTCGSTCFDASCSAGYCFDGTAPGDWQHCTLNTPANEVYESAALWADGMPTYQLLTLPDASITAKYIIEFRCFTSLDHSLAMSASNLAWIFRITAFTYSENNKARSLLRSTLSLSPGTSPSPGYEGRNSWEMLDIPF